MGRLIFACLLVFVLAVGCGGPASFTPIAEDEQTKQDATAYAEEMRDRGVIVKQYLGEMKGWAGEIFSSDDEKKEKMISLLNELNKTSASNKEELTRITNELIDLIGYNPQP
jgi:predicted transcriptional regulator